MHVQLVYSTRILLLAVACVGAIATQTVAGEPSLLLLEQTRDLLGGGDQLYLLEMRNGQAPEPPLILYGQRPIAAPQIAPEHGYAVLTTGFPMQDARTSAAPTWTYTMGVALSPLRLLPRPPYLGDSGSRTLLAGLLPGTVPESNATYPDWLLIRSGASDRGRENLAGSPAAASADAVLVKRAREEDAERTYALPGQPLQALTLHAQAEGAGPFMVLYRDEEARRLWLRMQDAYSGEIFREYDLHAQLQLPQRCDVVEMQLSDDKTMLWVAVSGFDLARTGDVSVTWLARYDIPTQTWRAPVQVTGMLSGTPPTLHPDRLGRCWLSTRLPGTLFGYVTLVGPQAEAEARLADDAALSLEKVTQYALTNVNDPILVAPDPHTEDIAVSWSNRLEIWPAGRRGVDDSIQRNLDATLRQLFYHEDALFLVAPEAVYRFESAGEPLETVYQARYGPLCQVTPLPSWVAAPDVTAPTPSEVTLRLDVRKTQYFRGEAVGRELHDLHINPVGPGSEDAVWRIRYDQRAMPWLRLHPRSGRGPGYVYMGIDPGLYGPEAGHRGILTIDVETEPPDQPVVGAPAHVVVRIAPPASPILRILWVWPEAKREQSFRASADTLGFKSLGDILATTPHYFSHREVAGPFQEPLAPYAIVVIGVRALLEGGITRQALLNYVQSGGGLLLLGEALEGESDPTLQRWLASLGIQIYTDTRVQTRRESAIAYDEGLLRPWAEALTVEGCLIRADEGVAALQADTESDVTLLAAGNYGLGRVVVLAGSTPLESPALGQAENQRFAESLFRWLARAGADAE